ncbi:S1C family serine protease [Pseudoflavonifractor phocaeensis]|uniref:S1C family serine protease n=1 Tax=Pseudoflavonifractor phocaeensis TaxID=1870988 RepID=UPI001FAF59B4|nr:trypsin-like peptidase domain-containing protein [Pseudoflavonifractor phocaeensis]
MYDDRFESEYNPNHSSAAPQEPVSPADAQNVYQNAGQPVNDQNVYQNAGQPVNDQNVYQNAGQPVNDQNMYQNNAGQPMNGAGWVPQPQNFGGGNVPPYYNGMNGDSPMGSVPPQPPRKKKKKGAAKFVALGLCLALLGGMVGTVGTLAATGRLFGGSTTLYEGTVVPTAVKMASIDGQTTLTLPEIYATNVGSTVGITTELVTTNYWGQPVSEAAAGSGFVISSDGYILTNYHVIDGADSIEVAFINGDSYQAKLVGGDEEQDIAVLKIEATGLTPVVLGDSSALHVGDQVCAIGNPLGELTYSFTVGYVSALDRNITMTDGEVMNMIQTDTAINSGNSGGPLFNQYGEVVGITSAKLSSSGSSSEASIEGLGFAIPINDIKDMVTSIIEYGYVTGKPSMGTTVATVTQSDAARYGWPVGVYVNSVEEGSAAEKAGLQQGDIITAIDGTEITQISDLKGALKNYKAGDTATLTLDRNGKTDTVEITFDEAAPDTTTTDTATDTDAQSGATQGSSGWGYGNPFGGFGY